ncbi:hypothetical protein Vadar_000472 [Vaccinium darrowii]|uniref:Uncharacterized protein n=1 Tax=Vaccinium darrowii TaxID=229202 RepID=A0ACB7XM43_9ERIC|nr:hypothetical protein Vadar_000472 [Vaccinium darrowii]
MAEKILLDVAGNILSSLGSYASQEIGLALGVKEELRKMENNVSTIKNILLDAQERQMSNLAIREWLQRLKLILYDADDLLDEVATKTKIRQGESLVKKVHYFFTSSNPLLFSYVVGRKFKDVGKRLDEIVLQMHDFQFVVKLVERPIEDRREETSSMMNTPTMIVGREDDKNNLVRLLLSSCYEENIPIIPIVGMGGLGGDGVDSSCINGGLDQLQNRVRNMLGGTNFLLVFDDVWNEDRVKWKILEDCFITLPRGSKVVVTTRSDMVASIVRTTTVKPYKLEGIGHLSCLRELVLDGCSALVSLPAGFRHLTSLERLEINSCVCFDFSNDDFKGLISLKKLQVNNLPRMVNLPKGIQDAAASLTHLEIIGCANFTSPSEFILPNLLSLQSLRISHCPEVRSLPEGMQRLINLHCLSIVRCNLLSSSSYEGGEDWPKVAHIPCIELSFEPPNPIFAFYYKVFRVAVLPFILMIVGLFLWWCLSRYDDYNVYYNMAVVFSLHSVGILICLVHYV